MSRITNLLARPSPLGAVAVIGSGALYLGLKYRSLMASAAQRSMRMKQDQTERQERSYEVKSGQEGGGV